MTKKSRKLIENAARDWYADNPEQLEQVIALNCRIEALERSHALVKRLANADCQVVAINRQGGCPANKPKSDWCIPCLARAALGRKK